MNTESNSTAGSGCPATTCSPLCLAHGPTPETDALIKADAHHNIDGYMSETAYDRMADHACTLERERNWNEDAWRRVVESRAILQEALKTVIVLASENPDMLVMHVLASDSPIRRAWKMSQANA